VRHAGEEERLSADSAGQAGSAEASKWGEGTASAPGRLRCRTERREDTVVMRLSGDLDLAAVPRFESARAELGGDFAVMVLDLSELAFIDSTGLRAVIAAMRDVNAMPARLEIVPGPPAVQRVFEVTGLIQQLPFRER
jgi:anti-anti-sigma factor